MVSCAKCCRLVARFTGLFLAKILVISASVFFLMGAIFLFWAGGYFSKHEIATELGLNSQILIGSVSVGILLFFNFMLVLPIITSADKTFSKLFSIMSIFFAIVFFAYGGVVLKGKTQIYDYVQTECSKPNGYFGDFDRIHVIAENFACSSTCECQADKTLWDSTQQAKMNASTTSGVKSVSDCADYQAYVKTEGLEFDNTLGQLETYFECSGICYKSTYYSFTDISKGPPTQNCIDSINSYLTKYTNIMAGMSIAVGILLSLGVIGSMIIICCIGTKLGQINETTTYKYDILEKYII